MRCIARREIPRTALDAFGNCTQDPCAQDHAICKLYNLRELQFEGTTSGKTRGRIACSAFLFSLYAYVQCLNLAYHVESMINEKVQCAPDQPRLRFDVRLCSVSFHEADGIIRGISVAGIPHAGEAKSIACVSLLVDLIMFVAVLAKPFADYQKAFRPLSFCERYVTLMPPRRNFSFQARARE